MLALIGAAAVVTNVWQPWYRGVEGRHINVGFLFGSSVYGTDSLWHSLFSAALVVAVIAVLGVLAGSRLAVGLAGLAGVAVVVLWVVFRARANDPTGLSAADFQSGLWSTLAGGAVMWLAAAVLPGRRSAA